MDNVEAHRRLATITAVARQLALDMAAMPDDPPGRISKFSTYIVGMIDDPTPKVGRCVVTGWGSAQERQLIKSAREAAAEIPGALATAVVSGQPTPDSPSVDVTVFAASRQFTMSFPCHFEDGKPAFHESEQAANARISEQAVGWVQELGSSVPQRKKFLGLF